MSYRGSVTLKSMPMINIRPRSEYSDETLSVNNLYDRRLQKQLEQYDKNTQALKKKLAKEKANLLRSVKAATATSNGTNVDKSSIMRPRSQSMVSTNSNGTTWEKYVSKRASNSQQNLSTTDGNHAAVTRTSSDSSSNNEEERKARPRSNSTGRFRRRLSSQGQASSNRIPKSSSSHSLSPLQEPTISTIQTAKSYKTTETSSADQSCIKSNDKQSLYMRPRSATLGSDTIRKNKTQDFNYIRRKSVEINGKLTLSQVASNPQQSKKYFRRCSNTQDDQRSVKMALPLTAVLQPSVDDYKVRLPQIKTDLSP